MTRFPRLALFVLALALAVVLAAARPAVGPNAARIARGLPPLPPKRQFDPAHLNVAKRVVSAVPPTFSD
ncbi:hypothetical protein Q5752_004489 [Cryptotrichosporon argae]